MDLVYIPEVLTYGSFRSPQFRDYEQPWNKDYFNYGKSTQIHCQRFSQQQHRGKKTLSKENCHLCRESKRRTLAAYIRGKSRKNSCQEIHEEEEEHDGTKTMKDRAAPDNDEAKIEKGKQSSECALETRARVEEE